MIEINSSVVVEGAREMRVNGLKVDEGKTLDNLLSALTDLRDACMPEGSITCEQGSAAGAFERRAGVYASIVLYSDFGVTPVAMITLRPFIGTYDVHVTATTEGGLIAQAAVQTVLKKQGRVPMRAVSSAS
jgi:hypothetical protein